MILTLPVPIERLQMFKVFGCVGVGVNVVVGVGVNVGVGVGSGL